jgi:hypothetical protein
MTEYWQIPEEDFDKDIKARYVGKSPNWREEI